MTSNSWQNQSIFYQECRKKIHLLASTHLLNLERLFNCYNLLLKATPWAWFWKAVSLSSKCKVALKYLECKYHSAAEFPVRSFKWFWKRNADDLTTDKSQMCKGIQPPDFINILVSCHYLLVHCFKKPYSFLGRWQYTCWGAAEWRGSLKILHKSPHDSQDLF